jgi:hypothetical protein
MLFSMHFWPKIVNSYGSRLSSFSLDPSSGPMRPPRTFLLALCGPRTLQTMPMRPSSQFEFETPDLTCICTLNEAGFRKMRLLKLPELITLSD